ncbi:alpha-E domain-containing protein [Kineococcus sp. NPDC059986]|uniref:alpha-E domain-containing protein n=1 Tax=Kineococcus sp. NPDC059986 TaxID=3155538 RepID=UPI00344FF59B
MLSRIAESLFWIGRYVERADSTARILDVHVERTLADPWIDESAVSTSLLAVMGSSVDPQRLTGRRDLLELLAYDPVSPSSITGALGAARENARRARETVSSDMWESLNTTWNALASGRWRAASPHRFFSWIRERTAVISGLVDATMSRDDSWQFFVLGRSLERADMTARLVDTRAVSGSGSQWPLLLRSTGAYEAFLRAYHGSSTGAAGELHAVEFLLLDRLFPRSVVNALETAEACLDSIDPASRRIGYTEDARRVVGMARTRLEFQTPEDILGDLHHQMRLVTEACSAASHAVAMRFFPMAGAVSWTAGRS